MHKVIKNIFSSEPQVISKVKGYNQYIFYTYDMIWNKTHKALS